MPIFEDICDSNNIKFRYHQTDKWWLFPWSTGKMYVTSAEKRIRGPNWGWAIINEIGLISWQRYQEILGRVRIKSAPFPQIASSGTPEGIAHWTYEKFVDKPMKRSRIIYGDTRDNARHLGEDYIQTMEETYDRHMLEAYLRGMFVNMSENRFYYSYDPMKNDDDTIVRRSSLETHISLDYNVDPMCATLWHIIPVKNKRGIYSVDANGQIQHWFLAYDQIELGGPKGADTNLMCEAFKARGLTNDNTIIYPDPSGNARSTQGQPDNEILRTNGFHQIRVRRKAPQFRKRQLAHNNFLDKGLIKLNPIKCKGLKKDYEAVTQNPATYAKIKDNPRLTHHSDGADYMIDYLFPLSGSKPSHHTSSRIR